MNRYVLINKLSASMIVCIFYDRALDASWFGSPLNAKAGHPVVTENHSAPQTFAVTLSENRVKYCRGSIGNVYCSRIVSACVKFV